MTLHADCMTHHDKILDCPKEFLIESNLIEDTWDEQSLKQALKAWDYLIAQKSLTKSNILKTHAKLMKGKLPVNQTGAWRRVPVWIGGHEVKPWYAVPDLMTKWIHDQEKSRYQYQITTKEETAERIRQAHIVAEKIHPVADGNGRLFRLVLNWQRLKSGLPILVIKYKDRFEYYKWFK